jgi:pyruvate/2-oxoglutarate dehydrogenase complex dihydrolipoamide dehydrogenase (E3) component
MMDVDFLPEHLIIVGGSYIGLEFAQMYRRFGSRVTVVEMASRIVAREDPTPRPRSKDPRSRRRRVSTRGRVHGRAAARRGRRDPRELRGGAARDHRLASAARRRPQSQYE